MRAWLLVAVLGSGCNAIMGGLIAAAEGPPSAEGHLVGGGHPPSFVQKPEAIFALHKGRLLRLQTDGSASDELLDHVELAEVSPAGDAVATFGARGLWGVDAYSLNPARGRCGAPARAEPHLYLQGRSPMNRLGLGFVACLLAAPVAAERDRKSVV